jgi:hypothetical protein
MSLVLQLEKQRSRYNHIGSYTGFFITIDCNMSFPRLQKVPAAFGEIHC